MKMFILFIVSWGLIFWLGMSGMDNFYAEIPSRHNWKGALDSLALTAIMFAFVILFVNNV